MTTRDNTSDHRAEALLLLTPPPFEKTHEERVERLMTAQIHASLAASQPEVLRAAFVQMMHQVTATKPTRRDAGPPADLITIAEAAEFLDVTDRTIRRYISEGRLAAFRIGNRQIRLRRADVEALLKTIPTVEYS